MLVFNPLSKINRIRVQTRATEVRHLIDGIHIFIGDLKIKYFYVIRDA